MSAPDKGPVLRVPIWDRPTRIFHWTLVVLMPLLWWTAEEEMLPEHRALGYVALGLILFRVFWGVLGSSTARFASFVRGPRAMIDYARGRSSFVLGHNPLGALSVIALLGLVAAITGLGLVATDEDGLEPGPLSHLVSYDFAEEAADLHEDGFHLLLVLIALHVGAILFYLIVKRDNLVGPMVTGSREVPHGIAAMQPAPAWRFAVAVGLALLITLWTAGFIGG